MEAMGVPQRSATLLGLAALCAAALVTSSQGCTRPSDLYCSAEQACSNPARPFCDLNAEYQDHLNRCIENPFGTCTTPYDCTFDAPICDEFMGCVPCTRAERGNDACESLGKGNDTCNSDGRCIACRTDVDCDSALPRCNRDSLLCEPCEPGANGHASCQRRNADEPWCSDAGGCAECLSNEHCTDINLPLCNPQGQCVGCYEHEHCASGICNRDTGDCVSASHIVYADSSNGKAEPCGSSPGAEACLTLAAAVATTSQGTGRTWIKLAPGTYESDGDDRVIVQDGSLQLVGTDGAEATIDGDGANPTLIALQDGHLLVDTLTVRNGTEGIACVRINQPSSIKVIRTVVAYNGTQGIRVEDCSVDIKESKIHDNANVGLFVRDPRAALQLTSSEIFDNAGGGIYIESSGFQIINNYIHGNGAVGDSGTLFGGVHIANGEPTSSAFQFNTVTNNVARPTSAQGVLCTTSPAMTAANNIVYRRSVGDTIVGGNCNWAYSAIEGGAPGAGNLTDDPLFVSPFTGNYHLQPNSPCEGAADPGATLTSDFDGDARPFGTGRDIGADEIVP